MTALKDFFEAIEYRISEGYEYQWKCFGENVYSLDSTDPDKYSVSVIFDREDQTVYSLEAWDYIKDKCYRWIKPEYISAYKENCKAHNVKFENAFDDVEFIDLELASDLLDKANAMVREIEYDERVEVPLTLGDDQLFELMKQAHLADMTLNQYVEKLLRQYLENRKE